MKFARLTSLLLCIFLAFAILACGGSDEDEATPTPEPTEVPTPTDVPAQTDAPAEESSTAPREGTAKVDGSLSAYETGEKIGAENKLYVYFFAASKNEAGQINVSQEVVASGNIVEAAVDENGKFSAELAAGQYVIAVTDKPGSPTASNFSPVGDSDQQIVFLDLNDGDAESVEGFVMLGRIVSLPGPTPPVPTVIEAASKDYFANIKTDKGTIKVKLYDDLVPMTVNNFVHLSKDGFYDGVTFHRVLENFMAQTGDPTGTGTGGPGYQFSDEFVEELRHDAPGMLSMANSDPNTNGSQFFITFAPTPWLDGRHSVFGKVVEGFDVLEKITLRDPSQTPNAEPGDAIETIEILEVNQGETP